MRKIVYIVSDIDKSLAFEWIAIHLKQKFELYFILIGKKGTSLSTFLNDSQIPLEEITDEKYPGTIRKAMCLMGILNREKPHVVHTHLWRATLLGMLVAKLLAIEKRIFTRHHSFIHYDEIPAGRKWDRFCNYLSTDIVAISENVRQILIMKDKADAKKIHLIHHGFDLNYFQTVSDQRVERIREKYPAVKNSGPVIGVISRYLKLKGIDYIIEAFRQLRIKHPNAHLVLANADGNYADQIRSQLALLPKPSFTEVIFEEDIAALYRLFDVFIHVPITPNVEAFGQTYVEALAVGIPSIFTLSGVAPEFIIDQSNAMVVDFKNSQQIEKAIHLLLADKTLVNRIVACGKQSVSSFSVEKMISKLEAIYA